VYETDFAPKTGDKNFVEDLWARRKVGYLIEQIRLNGEKKELVDEVTILAKKYGIATPYTSYLIVPDTAVPVAGAAAREANLLIANRMAGNQMPAGLAPAQQGGQFKKVWDYAKENQTRLGDLADNRGKKEDEKLAQASDKPTSETGKALYEAKGQKDAFDQAKSALARQGQRELQVNKLGVDYSVACNNLKWQTRQQQTALRCVAKRNCLEVGGVWIDEGYEPKMNTVAVKAMSDAYFRILERHDSVREVFQLGNHLLWVTPNGTALVIDTNDGVEQMSDAEIDKLFVMK
jgi:Ca-activated chloride channel family protein